MTFYENWAPAPALVTSYNTAVVNDPRRIKKTETHFNVYTRTHRLYTHTNAYTVYIEHGTSWILPIVQFTMYILHTGFNSFCTIKLCHCAHYIHSTHHEPCHAQLATTIYCHIQHTTYILHSKYCCILHSTHNWQLLHTAHLLWVRKDKEGRCVTRSRPIFDIVLPSWSEMTITITITNASD